MSLDQIGQRLKGARESQGLSLAQIYERTKIPVNHLQSIEEGLLDELPEPVYVSGFIKRFGESVGLNGQALSDEYRQANPTNGNGDSGWAARAALAQPVMVSPAKLKRANVTVKPPNAIGTVVWPALLIVGSLALVAFLWNFRKADDTVDPSVMTLSASNKFNQTQSGTNANATGAQTQAGPTAPNAAGQQPPANTPSGDGQVSILASKHVWVDVKAVSTGETLYSGFLETGDRRDFKDPQGVRVHAGNGANVTVEKDGNSQTLGLPGKVTEKVFMAKNPTGAPANATTGTTADGTTAATDPNATVKPVVKKVVKKPITSDGTALAHKRPRSLDDSGSRGYLPGENVGGTRSIDVPYRYNDSRSDD